ncbi:MAG: hypothetical protein AAB483_04040 [Patescibacteria group bacterium]
MTPRNRLFLVIEIIVGVLILIGGVFVLATETKAPNGSTSSPFSTPLGPSTYISSLLQISLQYPYGWQPDPSFNSIPGIERYQGIDGFFQVDATNDPTPRKGKIIKKYPKPIKLGDTNYRYFVLIADAAHLKEIGDSVEFLNK